MKMAQTFFCLDGDSAQPLCFTTASPSHTVSQATPELLRMAAEILAPLPVEKPLVAADTEHYAVELVDQIHLQTPFDIITPMPNRGSDQKRRRGIPAEQFTRHWAGYATAVLPFTPHHSRGGPYYELVQRHGERPDEWHYNAPNQELLRTQYEDLPAKLRGEGIDPAIPWLYGFQLDFRFK